MSEECEKYIVRDYGEDFFECNEPSYCYELSYKKENAEYMANEVIYTLGEKDFDMLDGWKPCPKCVTDEESDEIHDLINKLEKYITTYEFAGGLD